MKSRLLPLFALMLPPALQAAPGAPEGLLVELLQRPEETVIRQSRPGFSWIVKDPRRGAVQSAYRLIVRREGADEAWWDSGRVESDRSIDVLHGGAPLAAGAGFTWQVMTWDGEGEPGPWSERQTFFTAASVSESHPLASDDRANVDFSNRHPLVAVDQEAASAVRRADGSWFVDFGRAAFGNLVVKWEDAPEAEMTVRMGEMLAAPERIERRPPGTVRHQRQPLALRPDRAEHLPALDWSPPGWMREGFLGLPREFGQIMPFRYAEIENPPAGFDPAMLRRRVVGPPFDRESSDFSSSSASLDRLWDFCKYSIEATTFMGIYVDGDRERKPYEADAFINQLCHYGVERDFVTARHSHEFLLQRSTWPLEWHHHSVLMAWEDYLHTGNPRSMEAAYDLLAAKTLIGLAREDGLIVDEESRQTPEFLASIRMNERIRTIVDWPEGERDGHRITPVDSVANAFHYRSLVRMGEIAAALDRDEDATRWRERAERVRESYQRVFFDPARGIYRDGEGVDHSSMHSNLFPLALGLVPDEKLPRVMEFVKSKGMACSVYGSHHLLEALYEHGEAEHALDLMESRDIRGWHNMMEKGSTLSMEAWDQSFKPNQDWNHAWGAAPAGAIPRGLVGVRPLEPGARRVLVRPQPGNLERVDARVPTIRGPVEVAWRRLPREIALRVTVPANTTAEIHLPTSRPGAITEGGIPLLEAEGVRPLRHEGGVAVLEVGGGTYEFRAPR